MESLVDSKYETKMPLTNTLAYYSKDLIKVVKSFIAKDPDGATTFSLMTFSITTLSIVTLA